MNAIETLRATLHKMKARGMTRIQLMDICGMHFENWWAVYLRCRYLMEN